MSVKETASNLNDLKKKPVLILKLSFERDSRAPSCLYIKGQHFEYGQLSGDSNNGPRCYSQQEDFLKKSLANKDIFIQKKRS